MALLPSVEGPLITPHSHGHGSFFFGCLYLLHHSVPASDNGNSGVPSLSLVLIFKVLLKFFIWVRIPYFTYSSLRKSIQSHVLTVFGSRVHSI